MPRDAKRESRDDRAYEMIGRRVQRLGDFFTEGAVASVELRGLSVRPPTEDNAEFLLVIRAYDDAGAPVVGFHSGLSLGEALAGLYERLDNASLRWKEDEYAR